MNKTSGLPDLSPDFEQLIRLANVDILSSHFIETRSGQRSVVKNGRNHTIPTAAFSTKQKSDEEGEILQEELNGMFEKLFVGTEVQADPVLNADGISIDLAIALSHDYAPPILTPQPDLDENDPVLAGPGLKVFEADLTTSGVYLSGSTRLIGIWDPTKAPGRQNEDVLQAAFVRVGLVHLDYEDEDESE